MWAQLMYADENMETIISFGCKLVSSDGAFVECAGNENAHSANTYRTNLPTSKHHPRWINAVGATKKNELFACVGVLYMSMCFKYRSNEW